MPEGTSRLPQARPPPDPSADGGEPPQAFRRKCFSVWIDSDAVNTDEEVNLRSKHLTPAFSQRDSCLQYTTILAVLFLCLPNPVKPARCLLAQKDTE